MLPRAASAVVLVLVLVTGVHHVACQTASPSPEAKSTFERAKENTITHHTGVNVTTGEEVNSQANSTANATESLGPASGPRQAPSEAPSIAEGPASGPAEAVALAPELAAESKSGASAESAQDVPARSNPHQHTPATPAISTPTPSPTPVPTPSTQDYIGTAVDKNVMTQGAGVASGSRYGSVIAGTLVAAVVTVGVAGTVMVWRRKNTGTYQGLHDTEMAMIRREH